MARLRQRTVVYPGINNVYTFIDEAPNFDTSTSYIIGDYVIYNGDLYRFIENHPTGAWNDAHATPTRLSDEMKDLSNIVIVSDEEPDENHYNKMWVKETPGTTIQIPTMDDLYTRIPWPLNPDNTPNYGTSGQILMSNGDGTVSWVDPE